MIFLLVDQIQTKYPKKSLGGGGGGELGGCACKKDS